jgi:hypothetical protein
LKSNSTGNDIEPEELAQNFPYLAVRLNAVRQRVVDLLPLTRDHYYHPAMNGSWPIKAVLPTIADDLDYTTMEVGDGGTASETWLAILHPETKEEQRVPLEVELLQEITLGDKQEISKVRGNKVSA